MFGTAQVSTKHCRRATDFKHFIHAETAVRQRTQDAVPGCLSVGRRGPHLRTHVTRTTPSEAPSRLDRRIGCPCSELPENQETQSKASSISNLTQAFFGLGLSREDLSAWFSSSREAIGSNLCESAGSKIQSLRRIIVSSFLSFTRSQNTLLDHYARRPLCTIQAPNQKGQLP